MNTDQLFQRLTQKRDVLRQLRKLSDRQAELVQAGEMEPLLGVLALKQKLLAGLQAVEAALDPFRAEDPESRLWRSPAHRQAARELATECDRLLEEVKRLEQEDSGRLMVRRDAASSALEGLHGASRARAAYLEQPPAQTTHLDMSSDH